MSGKVSAADLDLAQDLAITVIATGQLIDHCRVKIGEDVWKRIQLAFPIENQFGRGRQVNASLLKLMQQLTDEVEQGR